MSQAQVLTSPSISLVNDRPATTSLAIAESFGKRHDHVVRTIQDLIHKLPESFSAPNFGAAEYMDEQGKPRPMFTVFFDGFILLVMGYTGKKALQMKLAYIAAFNAMKEKLDKLAKEERATLSGNVKEIPGAPLSTAASRAPLRSLVHAWAQVSGISHNALWPQVRAHFQLSRIDDLPESWLPDALAFVQEKIDQCVKGLAATPPAPELPPAPEPKPEERPLIYRDGCFYPPHKNKKHVAGPREKAILDFWSYEYPRREKEIEERFKKLLEDIDGAVGNIYPQAVAAIGRDADTMFSISCMLEGLYTAKDGAREAFKEALRLARLHLRMATSMATAMNR